MNKINAHLNTEDIKMHLSGLETEFADKEYRMLFLGEDLSLFMTNDQLIELHDLIGKKIYGESYSDIQDKCISLEIDLENANDIIEDYRETSEERRGA